MKFCQDHWDKLREAIRARGLWHLVASSGTEAGERIERELEGERDAKDYDPLMAANFAIWRRAVEAGGLYLMTGDYCPVCEAVKHRAGVVDQTIGRAFTAEEEESYWINGPADAQLAYARAQGLVSTQ